VRNEQIEVWWRGEPLKAEETALLKALFKAHYSSCFRSNPSSVTVVNAIDASCDFSKAVAAAILTIGGKHAPIEQTIAFLSASDLLQQTRHLLGFKEKIPGWGGTFQKDGQDPIWQEVDTLLREFYPELASKLDLVTRELAEERKDIYPNPSAYTACVALALQIPAKFASYLFIAGRLSGWARISLDTIPKD
jgi:citrate synthase